MKYSKKAPPPESFTGWLALENDNWSPTYANSRSPEKPRTHDALLIEQGFVCAYCGRGLMENRIDSHIDHFWPQAHFNPQSEPDRPDRTLDYTNFFASCGRDRSAGKTKEIPSTCGNYKGDQFDLANHIMPSDLGCEQRFSYGGSGLVMSAVEMDIAARRMIEMLNLNEPSLEYERKQIIAGIEQEISSGEITPATKNDTIATWRTARDGKLISFGHVAARYLEEESL